QQFYSLFAEDQFRPWHPLILTLGCRVQTRESAAFKPLSHVAANPHAAVVYVPIEGHSLRAEYSTSYRDPPATEVSGYPTIFGGAAALQVPNFALQREHHQLLSAGYRGKIAWAEPRLEGFYGRKDGLIINTSANLPPPDDVATRFNNIG